LLMDEQPSLREKHLARRIIREPLFWLLLQAGLIALVAWLGGFMVVGSIPDSPSYVNFDFSSLATILNSLRTPGYPLLLKALAMVSPDYRLLPAIQLTMHFLAVVLFWKALTIYGLRGWPSWAAASPLFYLSPVLRFFSFIHSDSVALSLAVMTVAFLFIVAARPRQLAAWFGLGGLLFLTYLTRPAYVLMVFYVPLAGGGLLFLRGAPDRQRLLKRAVPALAALALAPLIAFCSLRMAAVKDFGLCRFGTLHFTGITSQLLTEEDIAGLPADVRLFARRVQDERVRRNVKPAVTEASSVFFHTVCCFYNEHVLEICGPISLEMCGGTPAERDRLLSRYSVAVIRAKPLEYLRWLVPAFGHGVGLQLTYSCACRWGSPCSGRAG